MASTITVKESPIAAIVTLRRQLAERGQRSLTSFISKVREADISGEGRLDEEELDIAMRSSGVFLGKRDLGALSRSLDADGSGFLSVEELVAAVRGDLLGRRLAIVDKAFDRLCSSGAAVGGSSAADSVSLETAVGAMRVEKHPDVAAGLADGEAMRTQLAEALGRGIAAGASSGSGKGGPDAHVDREAFRFGMGEASACEPIEDEFVAGMEAVWGCSEAVVDEGVEAYLGIMREQADAKRSPGENQRQYLRRQLQRFDLDEHKGLSFDEFRRAGEVIGLPLSLAEAQRLFDAMPKLASKGGLEDVPRAGIDEAVLFVFGTDPQPTRG